MNVFELDQALVNDYERFARSFTLIRAIDATKITLPWHERH